MIFKGISKCFSLKNEDQYNTIGDFYDELSSIYGLENLKGLGYKWENGYIWYAIGLKDGDIPEYNLEIELPDDGWNIKEGLTDNLKDIYDELYKVNSIKYELETFTNDGRCMIKYIYNKD